MLWDGPDATQLAPLVLFPPFLRSMYVAETSTCHAHAGGEGLVFCVLSSNLGAYPTPKCFECLSPRPGREVGRRTKPRRKAAFPHPVAPPKQPRCNHLDVSPREATIGFKPVPIKTTLEASWSSHELRSAARSSRREGSTAGIHQLPALHATRCSVLRTPYSVRTQTDRVTDRVEGRPEGERGHMALQQAFRLCARVRNPQT